MLNLWLSGRGIRAAVYNFEVGGPAALTIVVKQKD